MKKLTSLKGVKALSNVQQKNIYGGISEDDPRIPIPTDGGGGSGGSGGGSGGTDCGWPMIYCAARSRCMMPVHYYAC